MLFHELYVNDLVIYTAKTLMHFLSIFFIIAKATQEKGEINSQLGLNWGEKKKVVSPKEIHKRKN